MSSDNTYTCSACNQVFEKGWDDSEAFAESEAMFGATAPEDLAVVCDDCFQEMTRAMQRIVEQTTWTVEQERDECQRQSEADCN